MDGGFCRKGPVTMRVTYHGTPKEYFDSLDPDQPYLPPEFAQDGFIHCTDGREAVSIILTLIYRKQPGRFVVLYIDQEKVMAPIKYEGPAGIYPHIYGPLNRDAIIAVREVERSPEGIFLMPPTLV
jgi:uncharacterized protein (DUF952 family)